MRLGKRERAALKASIAYRQDCIQRANAVPDNGGHYVSSQSRFDPVLRPVGRPSPKWDWNANKARVVHRNHGLHRLF